MEKGQDWLQTWLKSSCFANWRPHSTKSCISLPQGTHTQNINYQDYWFSPSASSLKDSGVEKEANPIGHGGNYQVTPLSLHTTYQLFAQRFLNSVAQHNTQDFPLAMCFHPCHTWRRKNEYMRTPVLQNMLVWWERRTVKHIKIWVLSLIYLIKIKTKPHE